jgi:hypothetical protein
MKRDPRKKHLADALQTLAQRAHLLPTISQSLVHAAGVRATSVSLKEKLRKLNDYTSTATKRQWQRPTAATERTRSSSVVDTIWLHLQKSLLTRSTPPLQSFITRREDTAYRPDADESLETTLPTVSQYQDTGSGTWHIGMGASAPIPRYMSSRAFVPIEGPSSHSVSEETDFLALYSNEQAAPSQPKAQHYLLVEDLLFHEPREDIA